MDKGDTSNLGRTRYTIGLLAGDLLAFNGYEVLAGAADLSQERGFNIIYFAGGWLKDPNGFNAQSNIIYDFINQNNVDGLIIWTSSLGRFVSPEEMQLFCERYRPMPIVGLGSYIKGIPSVLIDSYQAMCEIMIHMIEEHGYRRIAFVRGPVDHYDSAERFRAYQDILNKYHLGFDPDLITPPGIWSEAHGQTAIKILMDERRTHFDAVVTVSDTDVSGVLKELRARGIRIPLDVAVASFNDRPFCRSATPQITSGSLLMRERGRQAAEMVLKMLAGEQVPEKNIISGPMVFRRSCGCNPLAIHQIPDIHNIQPTQGGIIFSQCLETYKEDILAKIIQTIKFADPLLPMGWEEQLLNSFIADLTDKTSGNFIAVFEQTMAQMEITDGKIQQWNEVLAIIRSWIEMCPRDSHLPQAAIMLDQAAIYIRETETRLEMNKRLQIEQNDRTLIEIDHHLTTTFNIQEITDILAKQLPKLVIPSCYLCLYDQPNLPLESARLIMAYNRKGRIPNDLEGGGLKFPTTQLLPSGLMASDETFIQILEPLYYRENQLGYVFFEIEIIESAVYGSLQSLLSSALWSTVVFEKQKQIEASLARQTRELIRSNAELEQYAVVVSHDLQEPLRKITVFGERLQKTSGENLSEQASGYLERMISATTRMQWLIDDLLTYSRVTSRARPFVTVDLSVIAHEVLSDLEVQIKHTNAEITLSALPTLEAEPVQMRQLFQNLISNSLKFHPAGENPRIHICAHILGDQRYEIVFEDQGIGIDANYFNKIFGLFERLHGNSEYEGSGVGLAICKKIVEWHQGEIQVNSRLGAGTKFLVRLPSHQTGTKPADIRSEVGEER